MSIFHYFKILLYNLGITNYVYIILIKEFYITINIIYLIIVL